MYDRLIYSYSYSFSYSFSFLFSSLIFPSPLLSFSFSFPLAVHRPRKGVYVKIYPILLRFYPFRLELRRLTCLSLGENIITQPFYFVSIRPLQSL